MARVALFTLVAYVFPFSRGEKIGNIGSHGTSQKIFYRSPEWAGGRYKGSSGNTRQPV